MPKAILEFNLPEENDEFELASKATDMSLALWDIDQRLRNLIKWDGYENDPKFKDVVTTLETIRDEFLEIMNERNVSGVVFK